MQGFLGQRLMRIFGLTILSGVGYISSALSMFHVRVGETVNILTNLAQNPEVALV